MLDVSSPLTTVLPVNGEASATRVETGSLRPERDGVRSDIDRIEAELVAAIAVRDHHAAELVRLSEERSRLREQSAVTDTVMRFQAERLIAQAEEMRSVELRFANQSEALRDATSAVAERDEAVVALTEAAAISQGKLAAASARILELEEALHATNGSLSAEVDAWRSRAGAALAEAARLERALEESRQVTASVMASRAWRFAHWVRRRRHGQPP